MMQTMQAVRANEYGLPETFFLQDISCPQPAPGEVRIKVSAAGISFVDLLIAAGKYQAKPPLPFTPGSEFTGIVDAVGLGVIRLKAGDCIATATLAGAWAEYVCVAEQTTMVVPHNLPAAQAAVFHVPYCTALLGLQHRAALRPGETLFVSGATGSVGMAAVQVGKLLGATVIAGASTSEKREAAMAAGADSVIDTSLPEWPRLLKPATSGKGVDVVFDVVGGISAELVLRSLNWGGRYLVVGFASGTIPSFAANLALLKNASIMGVNVGASEHQEPVAMQRCREQLTAWLGEGCINPLIAQTFPLREFVTASAVVSDRQTVGRVVLTMN